MGRLKREQSRRGLGGGEGTERKVKNNVGEVKQRD
jgi:hypothetical protein